MKERPILFSGPMVRALLDGRKTQTRRVIKGAETIRHFGRCEDDRGYAHPDRVCSPRGGFHYHDANGFHHGELTCPYGAPGDRLWVRETWRPVSASVEGECVRVKWAADDAEAIRVTPFSTAERMLSTMRRYPGQWRPSIYCERWASRVHLDLLSVRVERLHDISDADIRAEGVTQEAAAELAGVPVEAVASLRDAWFVGWSAINGRASWDANPWVWVLGVRRVET